MTPLRTKMIEDMRLAGLAPSTQAIYLQGVRALAAHYKRSPDLLSEEEVRAYLLHLRDQRGVARGTFKTNHGGIRFIFHRTLERDWPLYLAICALGQPDHAHAAAPQFAQQTIASDERTHYKTVDFFRLVEPRQRLQKFGA